MRLSRFRAQSGRNDHQIVLRYVVVLGTALAFLAARFRQVSRRKAHLAKVARLAKKIAEHDPRWNPKTLLARAERVFLEANVELGRGQAGDFRGLLSSEAVPLLTISPFRLENIRVTSATLVSIEHYGDERDRFQVNFQGSCAKQAYTGQEYFDVEWSFGPGQGDWVVKDLKWSTKQGGKAFSSVVLGF